MRPDRQNVRPGSSVSNPATPTTAECLADGTMLELVRVNSESKLLIWRQDQQRVAERFESGNLIYETMSLSPTVLEAVRFPGETADYGSAGEFFEKILDELSNFTGLPDRELRPIPYWALSTCFPDLLSELPTLVVTGPSWADAHSFLRLLRCFCRRGVLLTELTPGAFIDLPMYLRPTVLMEQSKVARQLRGYLRAAGSSGARVSRSGGVS